MGQTAWSDEEGAMIISSSFCLLRGPEGGSEM